MKKIFVSTHPFGAINPEPLDILIKNNIQVELNPYKRKIGPQELKDHLSDKAGLIAGTEKLNKDTFDYAPDLKIIARVGIGLDGIDFGEVNKRDILLTYTPEAVTQAVAELTVANMLNLARLIPQIHMGMKSGKWNRIIGFQIAGKKIGIIGFGRVGQRVAKMLQGFSCEIFANDITPDEEIGSQYHVRFCSKEEIYKTADIITLHVPKTPLTMNLIDEKVLSTMKKTACLINTSRGGIVNENDLYIALKNRDISAAAIDVYEMEPYIAGRLCELDNIILTCHCGSCSKEARYFMELEAANEIVRYFNGKPPLFPVTKDLMKIERAQRVVPINAEWHELLNKSEENRSEKYKLYRKRWGQYPTYSIVGPYPLNIDIELINNKTSKKERQIDCMFSPTSKASCYMDIEIFNRIIDEFKTITEPTAIKLGFRGDPLYHPDFLEILEFTKVAGSIETIISTKGDLLNDDLIKNFIEKKLDVLNIFIGSSDPFKIKKNNASAKMEELCYKFDRIRHYKALAGATYPKLRIFTETDLTNNIDMVEFTKFWSHWADVVAVVDKVEKNMKAILNRKIKWACSRLWQRLVITYEGKFVVCNYDIEEKYVIGKFPEMSIKEAWNSEKMNRMRKIHQNNRSHEIDPCLNCDFRNIEMSKL